MDKTMNMPFEASVFNLPKMRNDAEKVAKDMGFEKTKEIDAFRHAYTSAKMQESFGETFAQIAGHGNEIGRDILAKASSFGMRQNPEKDWNMDVYNNNKGLEFEKDIANMQLTPEEKERMLRERIAAAVRNGELQTDPNKPPKSNQTPSKPSDIRTGPTQDIEPTTTSAEPIAWGGDGFVKVRAYSREGYTVKSHTRSLPDGDTGNNFSS